MHCYLILLYYEVCISKKMLNIRVKVVTLVYFTVFVSISFDVHFNYLNCYALYSYFYLRIM